MVAFGMLVSDASSGRLNSRFVFTSVSSNPKVFIVGAPPIDRSDGVMDLRLVTARPATRVRGAFEVRGEDCERVTMAAILRGAHIKNRDEKSCNTFSLMPEQI